MTVPDWYEERLASQLRMNAQTWAALQDHGVDANSLLCLDFFYDAPDQERAATLVTFLRNATDYDVGARSQKTRRLARRTWSVVGQTKPTALSLEILRDWTSWMVTAGAEHGACPFDGYGAAVV